MIEAVCKCYNNISQQDCGSKCNGSLIKRGNSKIPIFIYAFHMENMVHSYIAYILKHGINVLEKEHVRVCNDVAADLAVLVVVLVYVKNQKKQKEVPPNFYCSKRRLRYI